MESLRLFPADVHLEANSKKHDVQRGTDKSMFCSGQRRQMGNSEAAIIHVKCFSKEEAVLCSPICFLQWLKLGSRGGKKGNVSDGRDRSLLEQIAGAGCGVSVTGDQQHVKQIPSIRDDFKSTSVLPLFQCWLSRAK